MSQTQYVTIQTNYKSNKTFFLLNIGVYNSAIRLVHDNNNLLQINQSMLCGHDIPDSMDIAIEDVQLVFHTDVSVEDRGFRLVYETKTVDSAGKNSHYITIFKLPFLFNKYYNTSNMLHTVDTYACFRCVPSMHSVISSVGLSL